MTYRQALNLLNSFINYEWLNSYPYPSCFRLERAQSLLQCLGNPHQALTAIHIAGTKGKGSTCMFIAQMLKAAGLKVGLYTSPHLVDVRERIRILQKPETRNQKPEKELIFKKDFVRLIEKIKPDAEKLRKTRLGNLSYYELLTALAFVHFKEKKCDLVVLETGIGGRLDATNVVGAAVAGLTPISLEHRQVLGSTLAKIAREKAGIIKFTIDSSPLTVPGPEHKRQIVVTAPQQPAVLRVIQRQAKKCAADLYQVGRDLRIKVNQVNVKGQSFDLEGLFNKYVGLKIRLLGRHQLINAAVAVGCIEALRTQGIKIPERAIRSGLLKTSWPGRLQVFAGKPQIVLDAAHNRASAYCLKQAIAELFKFRNLALVLGFSKDKDVQGILKELLPLSSRIILTKTESPRAMQPEAIKRYIKTNKRPIFLTEHPAQALRIARQGCKPEDLILVSGSLYLLGQFLDQKNYALKI